MWVDFRLLRLSRLTALKPESMRSSTMSIVWLRGSAPFLLKSVPSTGEAGEELTGDEVITEVLVVGIGVLLPRLNYVGLARSGYCGEKCFA